MKELIKKIELIAEAQNKTVSQLKEAQSKTDKQLNNELRNLIAFTGKNKSLSYFELETIEL